MIQDRFRFFWQLPGSGFTQFYPKNDKLDFSYSRESDSIFFRKNINTDLVLKDDEYRSFLEIERSSGKCQAVKMYVQMYVDGSWRDFYQGQLRVIDGKYDTVNCKITIRPHTIDSYTCVFEKREKDVNLIDQIGVRQGRHKFGRYKVYVNKLFSRYVTSYEQDVDSFHRTLSSARVTQLFDDGDATEEGHFLDDIDYSNTTVIKTIALSELVKWNNQSEEERVELRVDGRPQDFEGTWNVQNWYAFEVYDAECDGLTPPDAPDGSGWTLIGSPDCNAGDTYYWYRPFNLLRCPTTGRQNFEFRDLSLLNPTSGGTQPYGYQWIYEKTCTSPAFLNVDAFEAGGIYEPLSVDNGMDFKEAIEYFGNSCGLNVVSNFYGINPDGNKPNNKYYTAAENQLQNLSVFQITDISNSFAENNATKASITFDEFFNDLKTLHNVDWWVNDEGEFQVEHMSFYENFYSLDLTTSRSLLGKSIYTYDQEDHPYKEEWNFFLESDKNTTKEFDGVPIEYFGGCVDDADNIKTYSTLQTVTNFGFFFENENFRDNDGILILATDGPEEEDGELIYYASSADSELTGNTLINADLSIPNLLQNYHTSGRPQDWGVVNNGWVRFDSNKRQRIGETIQIKISDENIFNDFDPMGLIKTPLGWGRVVDAVYFAHRKVLELNLRYR